ncbi:hypothetical protein K457DRAFT_1836886 [Linnemannia elongata AG-77]|uniref:Crinkler effector protein N-terminal domain-containing protein n=1 Tax=Linnemannia elongata AG-77 TaxID=1314771 RepID=A0A197JHU9_9FUNG|nr:hypothetical protein K457DRAFT_1836886 [Linnemannia elongata AG-77]
MDDNRLSLFCLVNGEATSNAFSIKIPSNDTVDDLKKLIKAEKTNAFSDIDADQLTLWCVSIPDEDDNDLPVLLDAVPEKKKLKATTKLSKVFETELPEETIHIIVQRPPQVHVPVPVPLHARSSTPLLVDSRPGTPLSDEKWKELLAQTENNFFAPDSVNYTSLVQLLKGGLDVPTTGGILGGLPFILPRARRYTDQPSLLFLNLPESPETQDPLSTADKALERIRGLSIPLLPLFGVSGCGKTRTAIEMLSKNWGFYFNGSGTDWGSGDLLSFLDLVQQRKRYQNRDVASNTHVHILALALVLSRTMILQRCLDVAEREGTTFTCKHWMLLQVGFRTMDVLDLFDMLFTSIADVIHRHSMDITFMRTLVREGFSGLRQRLLNLTSNMPFQHSRHKILLVIDEAQNLGKEEFGTFLSQQIPSDAERQAGAASLAKYKRPILSPLVHGFYQITGDRNQFCVIPCGTGLSIFDMKWLEDSAPVPKGYQEQLGPFTDFQGWESLKQVQNYRDLVRRTLPNDEARVIFDTRVPDTSVAELFERLRGRFRPIVSAIERMIMPSSGRIDWRLAIKETEDRLSSAESQYYGKGNIAFDISRMIRRVHDFESRYAKYQNIQATLKAFVLEHYLHGRPLLLNKEEAPLVEASVGRILSFGVETATVLDEPFALRAAVNYFRRYDPGFHSAICSLLGSGSNASVHGHQWEMAVLPSLAHVFHDKILSKTSLVRKGASSYDPILDLKAEIVGYANHLTLGTDFQRMSLDEFLDAHVHHGSRKDGKPVPPFHHPAETPTGPDVAFVLRFDNHGYCPVFVQLKMRHKMTLPGTQSAFSTVKSEAVQGHLQETMLQTFCTGNSKRFLGVVIAYPAELAGVEGTFPEVRRSERIRSAQGNDTPQCILLRIDKNNIHDLFPKNHMQALDLLKGIKRQLDQSEEGQDSDDQKDEPVTKQRRCEDDDSDIDSN